MDTSEDYYQLLHVVPDAPAQVIKASYRAMMQKLRHHPDLGGDPSMAQRLNLAVETLCDPSRRAQYDLERQHLLDCSGAVADACPAGGSPGVSPDSPPGGTGARDTDDPAHRAKKETAHKRYANQHAAWRNDIAASPTSLPARPHCLFCGASRANAPQAAQPYLVEKLCLRCDAPVTPIGELPVTLTEELRRINRYQLTGSVTLWMRWPRDEAVQGTMQDLSLAGCAIECDRELAGSSTVLLEAQLLSAVCLVRYCKPGNAEHHHQVGLEFLTLNMKAQPGTVFSTVA